MYIKHMKLVAHSATDIGLIRTLNQDSVLVDKQNQRFIVADGMGGHNGGEIASQLAVQTMSQELAHKRDLQFQDIQELCFKTNKAIYEEGKKNLNLRGMGTTLCALMVNQDGQSYILNIGDSRLYLERNNKLWLLTEDHNYMIMQKKINFANKENTVVEPSVDNNALIKSLGYYVSVKPDIFERKVEKGERYLLCSDGLSGFVSYDEIHTILKNFSLKEIPKECVKKAIAAGGEDNISVIVVEVK